MIVSFKIQIAASNDFFYGQSLPTMINRLVDLSGSGPIVVENRKGVFSRYPKKESGSWGESDRGGTRLCEKVHNVLAEWKVY